MNAAVQRILTINGGSSSIKFAVYDPTDLSRRELHGSIERIGLTGTLFVAKGQLPDDNFSRSIDVADHSAAAAALTDFITNRLGQGNFAAIGHQVVHGGPTYSAPQQIDAEMIAKLGALSACDPEHRPNELRVI